MYSSEKREMHRMKTNQCQLLDCDVSQKLQAWMTDFFSDVFLILLADALGSEKNINLRNILKCVTDSAQTHDRKPYNSEIKLT